MSNVLGVILEVEGRITNSDSIRVGANGDV